MVVLVHKQMLFKNDWQPAISASFYFSYDCAIVCNIKELTHFKGCHFDTEVE